MSNEKLLQNLREQHQDYSQKKEQAHANLQQIVGAIFATESMINKLSEILKEEGVNCGETDDKSAE